MTPKIAVSTTSLDIMAAAQLLAAELHLPYIDWEARGDYDFVLSLTPEYLGLQNTKEKKSTPFYIDFLAGKLFKRSKAAGLRKESLARAIGLKPRDKPFIIDATAGLGRDSFILATLGFEVTLLERSAILYALLKNALDRAQANAQIKPIIERMHLLQTDAILHLKDLTTTQQKRPDVIYLDPMFPERQKSAAVKKDMQILQQVVGKDSDSEELLQLGLTCATKRVVVKRPRLAPTITAHIPSFSMAGKSSRFDIYLVKT